MIWERLDECYGAPEVIENSLLERVDNFPKISDKDYKAQAARGYTDGTPSSKIGRDSSRPRISRYSTRY